MACHVGLGALVAASVVLSLSLPRELRSDAAAKRTPSGVFARPESALADSGLAHSAAPSTEHRVALSSYYVARADQRLCPSPMCGGIWVDLVNASATSCGDGTRQRQCYAASMDLSRLRVDEKGRVRLQRLVTEGRAVARGRLVRGLVAGFPELDTFVVSEVWTASSSLGPARGLFNRLRDNGVRCVRAPCFSIQAAVLNTSRAITVSGVRLSPSGATPAERRRGYEAIAGHGLLAAGRIIPRPSAGPGADGRIFVATQFFLRAAG